MPTLFGCEVGMRGGQEQGEDRQKVAAHCGGRDVIDRMRVWRQQSDPLADAAVAALDCTSSSSSRVVQADGDDIAGDAAQELLRRLTSLADAGDEACAALLRQFASSPAWADWDAVRRGQDVFVRHALSCCVALLHLSLAGGFGYPDLTGILACTGYLTSNAQATYRRIFETFTHITDCIVDGDAALRPGGRGLLSTLQVRLLHARVRRMVLRRRHAEGGSGADGSSGAGSRCPHLSGSDVPINQQQLATTLLGFSLVVMVGLRRMGIRLRPQEEEHYLHLWRVIGHYMGCTDDANPCTSMTAARQRLTATLAASYHPGPPSARLASHVLACMEHRFPLRAPLWLHHEIAHTLMGPDMTTALCVASPRAAGKPAPSLWLWWWWPGAWGGGNSSVRWFALRLALRAVEAFAATNNRWAERLRAHQRRVLRALAAVPLGWKRPSFELRVLHGGGGGSSGGGGDAAKAGVDGEAAVAAAPLA